MNLFNCPERSNCACTEICGPDKIDCSSCLNSIREAIIQIINAVKNTDVLGFNVDVNITTKNGVLNTINFAKDTINQVEVTKTTLIANGLAISICDIAKISVLSSQVASTPFNANLLNSIKNIATTCVCLEDMYNQKSNYNYNTSNKNSDLKCAQGMQNYINQNLASLKTVGYNGNGSKLESISGIDDIETDFVLNSATITPTTAEALTNATINSTTATVVASVEPQDVTLVTNVTTEEVSALSEVTPTPVDVCAPLTTAPLTITQTVEVSADTDLVTQVDTTPETVVTQVDTTTGTVVTGFSGGSTLTGVISGVNTIKNIAPDPVEIPAFTSTGTGDLIVKIPAKSIDGTNPVSDVDINVTVNGNNISFTGNTTHYVLPDNTNLVGGSTQAPQVSSVTIAGTPTTDTFIKTVTPQTDDVIKTITPQTTTGKFVTNVTTTEINNLTEEPTTQSVVSTLETQPATINNVTNVETTTAKDLLQTTTQDVLATAEIETAQDNFVKEATLDTTTLSAVTNINTSVQNVFVNSPETIDGTPFVAGDGIMGINNTNGDITIYSICDINSVEN